MTTPKDKSQEGPYTAYQSAVDPNFWLVRFGSVGPVYEYRTSMDAGNACDALNAAYAAGRASQWISVEEQTPDGDVLLAGPAYNNPATGEYWQRVGFYSSGMLYANDEFDPWEGYPPTHWMPSPAPPSNT